MIPQGCIGLPELAHQGGNRGGGVAVGRDHAGGEAARLRLDQPWILNDEHGRACIYRDGVPSQSKQADVKGQPSMEGEPDMHVQRGCAGDRERPDERWG